MPEKHDWFLQSVFEGQVDLTPEARALMVEHAESFLRYATLSSLEYQLLSPASRAAFDAAGKKLDEIRQNRIAELVVQKLAKMKELA